MGRNGEKEGGEGSLWKISRTKRCDLGKQVKGSRGKGYKEACCH